LETELKTGLERLHKLNQMYSENVQTIQSEIKTWLIQFSQAKADFEAINEGIIPSLRRMRTKAALSDCLNLFWLWLRRCLDNF
jgi:hypothetical protein